VNTNHWLGQSGTDIQVLENLYMHACMCEYTQVVCIRIYSYIRICMYMSIYIYAHVHTVGKRMNLNIFSRIYMCTWPYTYIVYIYVCIYSFICIRIYSHMHSKRCWQCRSYAYLYVHTHIYSYATYIGDVHIWAIWCIANICRYMNIYIYICMDI